MKDIWMTIKYFVVVFVAAFLVNVAASAQTTFKIDGDNYTSISKGRKSEPGVKTGKTYTARDGQVYDIYIKEDGYCYTIRKSKKTGKEYNARVPEDIARDICVKLGRKYTHKSNKIEK